MTLSISHLSTLPHAERYNEIAASLPPHVATAMMNVLTRVPNWRTKKAVDVRDWSWEQARHIMARNPTPAYVLRAEGFLKLAEVVED